MEARIDAKPPIDVVKDILATPNPPLPVLIRIVESPVFAPDGSLILTPGYNSKARTYYKPVDNWLLPEVSKNPVSNEIDKAKSLLLDDLLVDFPFVDEADRTNAIALFLLPFVRDMIIGPTPNHLIEAPAAGTGKGLLAEALLYPSMGHNIGISADVKSDDELRKRLTALFREARAVIQLDNMNHLDSPVLAAALTAHVWEDRVLGKSETIKLPIRSIWITTANNPTMSTEIVRRCVRIRLDPQRDRPWERTGFKHTKLPEWIKTNRSELVWAGLTLIQYWIVNGKPEPQHIDVLGSYETWTIILGGILENAGIEHFLANRGKFYEVADIEGTIWREFISAWWEKHRENETSVRELFPLASEIENFDFGRGNEKAQRTAFGMQLAKQRDRVIGDFRIVRTGTIRKANQWRLLPIKDMLFDPNVNLVNLREPFITPPTRATFSSGSKYSQCVNLHKGSQGSPVGCEYHETCETCPIQECPDREASE